jgi:hypothetical protein
MALLLLLSFAACRLDQEAAGSRAEMPDEARLQSGDLIYRFGNGLYSAYFRNISQTDQRFSHVGIAVRISKEDELYVVHAEADDYTGQGGVRMDRLSDFLKDANDRSAYRLNANEAVRLDIAKRALDYQRRAVPFDLAFDAADSTAFYCTELVLHCVNAAAGRLLIQGCTKINGKPVIAIDDTYLHDAMTPIPF